MSPRADHDERRTVLVLGADGYLGWPMSLHLSRRGWHVVAADSFSKRRWEAAQRGQGAG